MLLLKRTSATIENTATQERRNEVVEPLTNYNVLVLDQRFRQNSSVSFVNTNTTRNGSFRDANVSAALLFDLSTKANSITYMVILNTVQSMPSKTNGFKTSLNFQNKRKI
jgi:hypothetical protein